jgi:hypothetical protein
MRFALLIILLNSAFCFSQKAEFFCPKKSFQFSDTTEGALLKHTFIVYNKGKLPFEILNVDVECSCTSVDIEKPYIEAGDSTEIVVTFNTEGRVFYQDRIIKLSTTIRKKPYFLRFKVKVKPRPEN